MTNTDSSANALTLVLPLQAKRGLSLADFYDYWLNAHVTLPPRFPGIRDVWLHAVSFDDPIWPPVSGVSSRPAPEDDFHGVPEATFRTMEDLAAFQGASRLQMEDGINFLGQQIAYVSIGDHSMTLRDRSGTPAPEGHDGLVRHLLFLRRRSEVPVDEMRTWVVETFATTLAGAPEVLKVRSHLFEPVEVTLDHPGVVMSKPLDRQYQACVEVVVADRTALAQLGESTTWRRLAESVAANCEGLHAARVDRCITTKHDGQITFAGVRGFGVADVVYRLGADSQRQPAVSALFLA